jgi:magnesium-transporting ATPase (P-type)
MLENETLKPWHAMRTQEVFGALNVEATGLTQEEAMKRLAQFGPNELREEKKKVSDQASS